MAKTLTGTVVSSKPNKTIVVAVQSSKTRPLYRKQFTVSKHFMAHDENNEAQEGDRVVIIETRPMSALKRFRLERIVERAAIRHEEPEVAPEAKADAESEEA